MSAFDEMRGAGFSEQEIADYAFRNEAPVMRASGFTDNEISSYISGLWNRHAIPDAMLTRFEDDGPPPRISMVTQPGREEEAHEALNGVMAPVDQGLAGFFEAIPRGVSGHYDQYGQTLHALGPGRLDYTPSAAAPEAGDIDFKDWQTIGPKIGYRIGGVLAQGAELGTGIIGGAGAGGVGGFAVGGPPGALAGMTGGGLVGGVSAAMLQGALSSIGPYFYSELAKNRDDVEGAYHRAVLMGTAGSLLGGLSQGVFFWAPFKSTVMNMLLQGAVVQPEIGMVERGAQNIIQGKPPEEGLGEAYVQSALGTAAPVIGMHAAAPVLRGVRNLPPAVQRTGAAGVAVGGGLAGLAAATRPLEDSQADNNRLVRQGLLQSGEGTIVRVSPQTGRLQSVGNPPTAQDFTDAAKLANGGRFSATVRNGLIREWQQNGVHPAEIAADAQIDPSLARFSDAPLAPEPKPLPGRAAPPAEDRIRLAINWLPPWFRLPRVEPRVEPPRVEPPRPPEVRPEDIEPGARPRAPGEEVVPAAPAAPAEPAPPAEPEVHVPPPGELRLPGEPTEPREPAPPAVEAEPALPPAVAEPEVPVRPGEVAEPRFEAPPEVREPALDERGEPLTYERFEPNIYERQGAAPFPSNQNVAETGLEWAAVPLESENDRLWVAESGDVQATISAQWSARNKRYQYWASVMQRDAGTGEHHTVAGYEYDNVDDAQLYVEKLVRGGRYDAEGQRAAERAVNERDQLRKLLRPLPEAPRPQAPPEDFFDHIWSNYAQRMSPEEFLRSGPAWSGARVLAERMGWREAEAFSYLANEMFSRMGATQRMSPREAARFMGRERGIGVVPDEPLPSPARVSEDIKAAVIKDWSRFDVLTPEARAREANLVLLVERELQRMLGRDFVNVMVSRGAALKGVPDYPHLQMATGQQASVAGLAYTRLDKAGNLVKGLIRLALGQWELLRTTAHEGFHIWQDYLATDRELEILDRGTEDMRGGIAPELKQAGFTDEQVADWPDKEVWAEAFDTYWKGRKAGVPHYVRPVFDKFINFLNRLANGLRGLGFRTYRDIFVDIYEGRASAPQRAMRVRPGSEALNEMAYREFLRSTGLGAPSPARGGIPFMITERMKADLRNLGYTDAQIADMRPAEAHGILNPERSFTTSFGSHYTLHPDGTTTRNKAARDVPGHEGDFGIKERSLKTYYATENNLSRLAPPAGGQWRVVDHGDGTLTMAWPNSQTGVWGTNHDAVTGSYKVPVEKEPRVGLHPIELWDKADIKGQNAYKNWHPGTAITEVRAPRPPLPPPVPPEQFAAGKAMLTEALDKFDAAGRGNAWVQVPETGESGQGLYIRLMRAPRGERYLSIANARFETKGTGAFAAYLDHLEQEAARRGYSKVEAENIENKRLIPFLRARGYVEQPDVFGTGLPVMTKSAEALHRDWPIREAGAEPPPLPEPAAFTPEMEAQYREYRRGGAAGPPENRTLWAREFEDRLKRELGGATYTVPPRAPLPEAQEPPVVELRPARAALTAREEHTQWFIYEGDRPVATARDEYNAQQIVSRGIVPVVTDAPPGAVPRYEIGSSLPPSTFHTPIQDRTGKNVGFLEFVIRPDEVQMRYPYIEEAARGQKLGVGAYADLVNWALSSGRSFTSETGKTDAAKRVYDALERRGYPVVRGPGDRITISLSAGEGRAVPESAAAVDTAPGAEPADVAETLPVVPRELPGVAAGEPATAETEPAAGRVGGPRRTGRAAADPATWTLAEYLTSHLMAKRGIKPTAELERALEQSAVRKTGKKYTKGPFVPGMGPVLRPTGMTIKEALDMAKAGGYLPEEADEKQLVDALTAGTRRPALRMGQIAEEAPDAARERDEARKSLVDDLVNEGFSEDELDPAAIERATDFLLARHEREPALAYERALMDESQYAEDTGEVPEKPQALPGWDDYEPEPAPDVGEPLPERAGAGAGPAEPEGVAAGELPRGAGAAEGPLVGAPERDRERSGASPAQEAAGTRSAIGIDQPLPAGAQREAMQDEARLAREAARENPQLGFDMGGRAAAAEQDAMRATDPTELTVEQQEANERARLDELERQSDFGEHVAPEVDPSTMPGSPDDTWWAGTPAGPPGLGGTGNGGAGEAAAVGNEQYRRGPRQWMMNIIQRFTMLPQMVAKRDPDAVGKLEALISEQIGRIEGIMYGGAKAMEPYAKLSGEARERVNGVLELIRRKEVDHDLTAPSISIINDGVEHTHYSSIGDTITISTPEEMAAYREMARWNQGAFPMIRRAMAMHLGVDPNMTVQELRRMAARPGERARERLLSFAKLLAAIEEGERKGYMPFGRYGDWYIDVRPRGEAGERPGPSQYFRLVETRTNLDVLAGRDPRVRDPVTGEMVPRRALEALQQERARFAGQDVDISHGQFVPTPERLAAIGLPAIERLTLLMGQDVERHIRAQFGRGASATQIGNATRRFWQMAIDAFVRDFAEETKRGFTRRARNTPGYDRDFGRVIGDYINNFSHYVGNLEYYNRIQRVLDNEIANHRDVSVREYVKQRMNDLERDPSILDKPARALKQGAFLWALGGNVSSFVTAVMHDPQKGMAILATTFGFDRAHRAPDRMLAAMRDVFAGVRPSAEHGLYIDADTIRWGDPRVEAWGREMISSGTWRSHGGRQLAGSDAIIDGPGAYARAGMSGMWARTMEILGSGMHIADMVNRSVGMAALREFIARPETFEAAHQRWMRNGYYRNLVELNGRSPETLARFIIEYAASATNPHNRAPIMRGAAGSTLFQFKTYTYAYLSTLHDMMWHMGPEGKMGAGIMLAALAAMGGLAAFPFLQDVKDATEWVGNTIFGIDPGFDDTWQNIQDALGMSKVGADGVLHGIPYATMNLDLGSRLGFGEEFRRQLDSPYGAGVSISLRAIDEAWNRYQSGQGAAATIAALSPNAIKSILLGQKIWPERGVMTQYGQQVLRADQLSMTDKFWRTMGYTPAAIAERYAERVERRDFVQHVAREGANLYTRIAIMLMERARALQEGDVQSADELTRRVREAVMDANSRGLITDGPSLRRAVVNRMRQMMDPERTEILKLPRAARAKFYQQYQKRLEAVQ